MAGRPPLVLGVDYYVEDGKFVFKAEYHLKRGYCCNSKCRHCPYGNASGAAPKLPSIEIKGLPAPPPNPKSNEDD
ncbi:MAG: hypothetical protein IPK82_02630 [Polyangiaceae bacterium]|nr:hypothetical protein [Polyangiaceae bacterium]